MATTRTHNIVVRVDSETLDMARKLSKAEDDPISRVLRRYIRKLYAEKFGEIPAAADSRP